MKGRPFSRGGPVPLSWLSRSIGQALTDTLTDTPGLTHSTPMQTLHLFPTQPLHSAHSSPTPTSIVSPSTALSNSICQRTSHPHIASAAASHFPSIRSNTQRRDYPIEPPWRIGRSHHNSEEPTPFIPLHLHTRSTPSQRAYTPQTPTVDWPRLIDFCSLAPFSPSTHQRRQLPKRRQSQSAEDRRCHSAY